MRECQVYSEIVRCDIPAAEIEDSRRRASFFPAGRPVFMTKARRKSTSAIFSLGIPVLGICYGMQLMAHHLGGEVEFSARREYGAGLLAPRRWLAALRGPRRADRYLEQPRRQADRAAGRFSRDRAHGEFRLSPRSKTSERQLYALQFHPEVSHTPRGKEIIENFLFRICHCAMDWTMGSFIDDACERIRRQVGDQKVVLGLSGGVDSSVAAALLHKAIGDQLTCIFVNNGLLRENEAEMVQRVFGENFHIRLKYVDASERFLSALAGVTDPETKRKIIGREFIGVFEDATEELGEGSEVGRRAKR